MRSQRYFEIPGETTLREVTQIKALVADLSRIIKILNCDIATEEERTLLFDRSDAKYSILARTLTARRENLKNTVAALEQRLAIMSFEGRRGLNETSILIAA
jgi:hypothetical protein